MRRALLFILALFAVSALAAAKNVTSRNWVIAPSFDGLLYSAYPLGNKPPGYVTAPTIISTDIVSGSTTGGENNKGSYLSVFGYNFGTHATMGTPSGVRAYLRTHAGPGAWVEVDNYRFLGASKTFAVNQVQVLIAQIGALGSPAAGSVMDLKLTVNGTDTNILSSAFTIQPGRFFYVDNASGSDATGLADDITKPFRYLQHSASIDSYPNCGSTTFDGIFATTTAQGQPGIRPGDTVVMRTGTGVYRDQLGLQCKMMRLFRITGAPPKGQVQSYRMAIAAVANNGSGAIRLTVASTAGMTTNEWVIATGMDYAMNGQYQITVVDGTHADLQGSTFATNNLSNGFATNGSGYIHITAYPGPAGSNAPETVQIDIPSVAYAYVNGGGTAYQIGDVLTVSGGTSTVPAQLTVTAVSGGVITAVTGSYNAAYTITPTMPASVTGGHGSGATFNIMWGAGALQGASTANAALGYGRYLTISNLFISSEPTTAGDAGLINMQAGADAWRMFNNNLGPALTRVLTTSPSGDARTGAIVGVGNGFVDSYNYIHDIGGDPVAQQNHGIYYGSENNNGYNQYAINSTSSYNWIYNILGGSGVQWNSVVATGSGFTGNAFHHNVIDTTVKYGINFNTDSVSCDVYDNTVANTLRNGLRFNLSTLQTGLAINVLYNTFYNTYTDTTGSYLGSIDIEANVTNSGIVIKHNTIALKSGQSAGGTNFYVVATAGFDTQVSLSQNLWYDFGGVRTAPAKDASAVSGNPNFTNAAAGNFTVTAGGAGLGAASLSDPITVSTDLYGVSRPGGGTNDIGATQGVGM